MICMWPNLEKYFKSFPNSSGQTSFFWKFPKQQRTNIFVFKQQRTNICGLKVFQTAADKYLCFQTTSDKYLHFKSLKADKYLVCFSRLGVWPCLPVRVTKLNGRTPLLNTAQLHYCNTVILQYCNTATLHNPILQHYTINSATQQYCNTAQSNTVTLQHSTIQYSKTVSQHCTTALL